MCNVTLTPGYYMGNQQVAIIHRMQDKHTAHRFTYCFCHDVFGAMKAKSYYARREYIQPSPSSPHMPLSHDFDDVSIITVGAYLPISTRRVGRNGELTTRGCKPSQLD